MEINLSESEIIDEISTFHANDEHFILEIIKNASTSHYQERQILRLLIARLISFDELDMEDLQTIYHEKILEE